MKSIKVKLHKNIFGFLLLFTLIFVSNDTLLFGTNANRVFFYVHIFILLSVLFAIVISKRILATRLTFLYVAIAFIICSVVTMTVNVDFGKNSIKYLYTFFEVVLAFFVVNTISQEDFEKHFVQIMYALAWFSILLFVISLVAYPFLHFAPTVSNENGVQYYWFGFGFLEALSPTSLPRMYGIFREPGVFAVFLLLALIMELFLKTSREETSLKKVLILSAAAFLTFSTAAVILEFVILALYVFSGLADSRNQKAMIFAAILFVALAAFFYFGQYTKVFRVIFGKLYVENNSASSRIGSFRTNWMLFKENPLTGKGWSFVENNFLDYSVQSGYGKIHDTNTILKYMAIYGFIPAVIVLIGSFRYFYRAKKILFSLFIVLIYFVLLSNEDLTVNIVFYLIVFYGYQNRRNSAYESIAD